MWVLGSAVRGDKQKQIRDWVWGPASLHSQEFPEDEYEKLMFCKHTLSHLRWPFPSPSGVSRSSCVFPFPTQIACQKRPSGHLVSVLSGAEDSFVASLVKNNLNTQSDIWIGLHYPTEVHIHLSDLLLPKVLWPPRSHFVPFASPENTWEIPGAHRITRESGSL